MKQLFYLSALGIVMMGLAACEDVAKNPGDFSLKPVLEVVRVRSLTTGEVYPVKVARSIDSTYRYSYNVYDTLKDESGEPILDNEGKLQISAEERYYNSRTTAKFVELEPIVFPSYSDVAVDTIMIEVASNANWLSDGDRMSPTDEEVTWYNVINSTISGGGDGAMLIGVNKYSAVTSRHVKVRNVLTRDSTVMYRLILKHTGLKYTGE